MIPQYFLDELLAKIDLIDVISPYVALKKSGSNWMGLCPFHQEKSPSFTVSQTKQFYHCFGCGEHGDAIGFLIKQQGYSFPEAVETLAFRYGLQVPKESERGDFNTQQKQAEKAQSERYYSLLENVSDFYQTQLRQTPTAIEYLKKRGISGVMAKAFGLGYAPENPQLLEDLVSQNPQQWQSVDLQTLGLISLNEHQKPYTRFRQRIMFPIRNAKGHVIGFGGRIFLPQQTKEAKYLNSPETPLFKKGQELYGLFEAKPGIAKHKYVLVVEGYLDVIALHQFGFNQAVASLGTAISTDQIQTLLRYQSHLVFAFDGDEAGKQAAYRALKAALPIAQDKTQIEFVLLTQGKDPDEVLRTHGPETMQQAITQATPLSHFWRKMIAEAFSLDTAEGRTHALSAIQEQWNQLPEGHFKQQMTYEIAGWVQMPIQDLQFLLTQPPPSFKRTSQTKNDVPYQNADRQTNRKKKQLDSFQRTYRTPNTHLSNIEQRLLLAVMAFPEQALRHTALQDFYRWCEELEELPETLNALTLLGAYLDNEGASDTVVLRTRLIENGMASLLDRLPVSPEQWHHLSQHESLKYVESEEDIQSLISDLIRGTQRQVIEQQMKWVLSQLSTTQEETERQQWTQRYRELTQQYQTHLKSYGTNNSPG